MMMNEISRIYILTALLSFALVFSGTSDANAKVLPQWKVNILERKICVDAASNRAFDKDVVKLLHHWRSSTQRRSGQKLTPKSINCLLKIERWRLTSHGRNIKTAVAVTNRRIGYRNISVSPITYKYTDENLVLDLRYKITY